MVKTRRHFISRDFRMKLRERAKRILLTEAVRQTWMIVSRRREFQNSGLAKMLFRQQTDISSPMRKIKI